MEYLLHRELQEVRILQKKLGAKIEKDKIIVNQDMETSIKGLFACQGTAQVDYIKFQKLCMKEQRQD